MARHGETFDEVQRIGETVADYKREADRLRAEEEASNARRHGVVRSAGTAIPSRKWAGLRPSLRNPSELDAALLEATSSSEWSVLPCAANPCFASFDDDGLDVYDEAGAPAAATKMPLVCFETACGAASCAPPVGCTPPASSFFGDRLCGCGGEFGGGELEDDEFVLGSSWTSLPQAEVPRQPQSQFPGGLPQVAIPLQFPSAPVAPPAPPDAENPHQDRPEAAKWK